MIVVVFEDSSSLLRTIRSPDRFCPGCGLRIFSAQASRVLGEHIKAEHPEEFARILAYRDTPAAAPGG